MNTKRVTSQDVADLAGVSRTTVSLVLNDVQTVKISPSTRQKVVEAADELGYECEDFMSPGDCQLMFNVCDPVICPSSRCDLGGKMKVANVVQSGIIGSIALCLQNIKEGIIIPVCLTGIHAGIDNWITIL